MRVLEPRDRLGGYTIHRLIRTGSTGQLYLGRRIAAPGFAPTSALKVFPERLHDPSPFLTAPPSMTSEAAIAAEKMVVPRLPALPLAIAFAADTIVARMFQG